jgi:hypothetical protein
METDGMQLKPHQYRHWRGSQTSDLTLHLKHNEETKLSLTQAGENKWNRPENKVDSEKKKSMKKWETFS